MFEPSDLLLQHLSDIEQITASICRRKGMDADDIEEFTAEVKLRLVENDYAIIRAFQNRSPFPVYIAAVVRRLLLDHRNHEWGKWRASAEAQRLGPLAIDLERILYRDGRTVGEALAMLAPKYPAVTLDDLDRIVVRLPVRLRRRSVELDAASELAAPPDGLDPIRCETASRVSEAVRAFIDHLPQEDQLVFLLRFESNFTVAQVARALDLDQAMLYRRLYRHFGELRAALGRAGIGAEDVEELIGTDNALLDFRLKNQEVRPSNEEESAIADRQEEIPT